MTEEAEEAEQHLLMEEVEAQHHGMEQQGHFHEVEQKERV